MACFAVLAGTAAAQAPDLTNAPDGEKIKILGYITQRAEEKMVVTTTDKFRYVVELTSGTSVRSNSKGVFRGGDDYSLSHLLRGLRVEVEGRGTASGAINADSVRFNTTDLRSAEMLEARIDPLEANVSSNTQRITANESQLQENVALTSKAQAAADSALSDAERAQKTADRANNRINGLDEYEPIKTIVVPFATGKFALSPDAKKIINEAAAWVKTQNTKGWMVSVVGFADSTGQTESNKTLSEKRANSVIGYLITTYNLPLTKLVQPFGAGVDMPAATNATAEGRAQNRRVEIRLLLNKGIAGTN